MLTTEQIQATRRYAVMQNLGSINLQETPWSLREARVAAARLGWTFSTTASLDEFYTHITPVWAIITTGSGERLYLSPDEWSLVLARIGRQLPGSATQISLGRGWEVAAWSDGTIYIRRDGSLDRVLRASEIEWKVG